MEIRDQLTPSTGWLTRLFTDDDFPFRHKHSIYEPHANCRTLSCSVRSSVTVEQAPSCRGSFRQGVQVDAAHFPDRDVCAFVGFKYLVFAQQDRWNYELHHFLRNPCRTKKDKGFKD
ncbi:hypothetical protein NQZ68_023883 [Dissostichus eleginoides]|nr:hypothetical protein NQZ68_023883 [Dissostichus eleginoides]